MAKVVAGLPTPCRNLKRRASEMSNVSPGSTPRNARVGSLAIELHVGKPQQQEPASQQPTLELALIKRRLSGKQPAPLAYSQFSVARGHYDVLGVRRTATANEIHAAYRRQILRTHPDKGGDVSEFRRVISAWHELSDASRRGAYDRSLDLFGRKDGTTLAEPTTETKWVHAATKRGKDLRSRFGAARAAHIKLLGSTPQAWPWLLSKMEESVLEGLRDILKGKKVLVASESEIKHQRGAKGKSPTKSNSPKKPGHDLSGIIQNKSGYKIEVSWSSFCICTGYTKSISQAIDWQIVLSRARSKAQLRMKKNAELGPLTGEELLQVLQEEPSMDLAFYATVQIGSKKNKKVVSPVVPDLNMAKDFHKRLLALASARKPESVLQQEKRRIDKEAGEGRRIRRVCENQLSVAVSYEMRLRAARSSGKDLPQNRAGNGRKRKRDEETSLAVVPAEHFKPHRRIRGKMPVAVLAIALQEEIGYTHGQQPYDC